MIFSSRLPAENRSAIIDKINQVCSHLGIQPNWLMAVINFETAGTFSTSIENPHTGATGLIQFMPSTAEGLGTSTEELASMSFIRQLDFVERYYTPYRGKVKSFVDLYLATFWPAAIGKPDDFVIESSRVSAATIARQNPVFDPLKRGYVTVGSIKTALLLKTPTEYAKELVTSNGGTFAILAGSIITIILIKNLFS